ncbi:four helix bundle protein [Plebeiibacterium sediminum]|uniref:Four helix bundle protein n=1 Tax=Plebeiibacterium sediminum TaxID=2992112 RepID=A0AAE3M6Q8_9BACT|nr:four helix bundle protein [Plebeiobacterium sediminum]MCW3788062.1 four helix bundle protein [Plebeiobacterium sediminum]
MHNFRELKVWQKGRILVKEIYLLTLNFPKAETFGLTDQMRRASVSIPANIAEGSGRKSNKDFKRFLEYAYGSALELETHIYLSYDVNYIDEPTLNNFLKIIHEIEKMITGLDNSIN